MRTNTPPISDREGETDRRLAAHAAGGNHSAQRKLVERLLPHVRTTVHYLVHDDRDADDLVQSSLLETLRSVGHYRGDCSIEFWSFRIVVRLVMRHVKKRRQRGMILAEREPPNQVEPITPEADLERFELRQKLKKRLGKLPLDQRTAVVLRLVYDYGPAEIAAITDTPVNTVRERLRIGRQRLRRSLSRDKTIEQWIGGRV